MRIAVAIATVLFVALPAHAQFGIGLSPAMQCPSPIQPAGPSFNGSDEVRNVQGQIQRAQSEIQQKKQYLELINQRVSRGKTGMRKVLGSAAIEAIEEHRSYRRNRSDYHSDCGGGRGASAGGSSANVVRVPGRSSGGSSSGQTPVPSVFCSGGENYWREFIGDDGAISRRVCEYYVPFKSSTPTTEEQRNCKNGLEDYYANIEKKLEIESEIAKLDEEIASYNRDIERIQDEITEGRYCPNCAAQRQGQATSGTADWLMTGVNILGQLLNSYQRRQQQQQAPAMLPFPGGAAYPGAPYAAPMNGYYGMHNGIYGAVPGGIGQGAFMCQGTSPYGMNNPMANSFNPYMNSQYNPFMNPYMNGMQNPYGNPLLNPGFGNGFMPTLGNGVYNPYDPYGQYGSNAPGLLPYQGNNPYFNNPYMYNPLAPYGSPYATGVNNPYTVAPDLLPYLNGNGAASPLANGNYPNLPYNNPWGAPHVLSPVQNFNTQIEQMKQNVQVIQNGGFYGGGVGAPPAILPMPGPAPVYNTPGTPLNPVPSN